MTPSARRRLVAVTRAAACSWFDDDPPLRRMLERTLTAEGFAVAVSGDGAGARLLREQGRTVTRERAIEEIWDGGAEPNVVDRYIMRLRRKLGTPALIRTVRGAGFTLRLADRQIRRGQILILFLANHDPLQE